MFRLCFAIVLVFALGAASVASSGSSPATAGEKYPDRIKPCVSNPRYWQYKGKPILLLGGTKDDNLFQIPDLPQHLDQLAKVGGNYIRNTMSSRKDKGFEVQPFKKLPSGKYDLKQWNDEYWRRFDNMLKLTRDRDIIVQIEVWAFHDFFGSRWEENPWNPKNNVNYTISNTMLQVSYANPMRQMHAFFFTVPNLNNDVLVLKCQQKFMDRILSYTLRHYHVLYCMTNEIHPLYSPEWGWYWSKYITGTANLVGNKMETTEMFWTPDLKAGQHRASLDQPEFYSFFEASQNSARKGQENWDNLQFVYQYVAKKPRPINHTKIYGADTSPWQGAADRDAIEILWRNIIGGSASSRFHRPPAGIGLDEQAQAHIRSMRLLMGGLDILRCTPDSESKLLSERDENEAYLTCVAGEQYAVYFPDEGSVALNLSGVEGSFALRWLDIGNSKWKAAETVTGDKAITLKTPGKGHWVALLTKKKTDE